VQPATAAQSPPVLPQGKTPMRGHVIAALIAAIAGLGGGYTAGAHVNSDTGGQLKQAQGELAAQKDVASKANAQITQLTADLTAAKQHEQEMLKNSDSARTELQNTVTQLKGALAKASKDRDQNLNKVNDLQLALAAARDRERVARDSVAQSVREAENASAARILQLNATVTQLQNELTAQRNRPTTTGKAVLPGTGYLVWSGELNGKKTVEIRDGVASPGRIVKGSLPGQPCIVVAADPSRVKIKSNPAKDNQWNRLAFETSGSANQTLNVTFYWTLQQ